MIGTEELSALQELSKNLTKALADLSSRSDQMYCQYIKKMSSKDCLGWEAKVSSGAFGVVELDAHSKANELLGAHRGLSEAIKAVRTALAATAASITEAKP